MTQTKIPGMFMRGGTSKGMYFLAQDLPAETDLRDRVLISAMGSMDGDKRQIDGLGGADPLTSKVAIVSPSTVEDADVDYLFAQVVVGEERVDTTPNCGNMLAGVGAFAIERGLVKPNTDETTVRIHMVNSGNLCDQIVQTPGGQVEYEGEARIDGVPGTGAPVKNAFLDTAGSACGSLLPTGAIKDEIDGIDVTCIDNGMPVVLLRAEDVDRTGYESRDELNADEELKEKLESIRLQVGPKMNLGNVKDKVVPKMTLIASPQDGGAICTRSFIPHVCHAAIGVLASVSVATACVLPGSVADGIARLPDGKTKLVSVEHPTGEFTVELEVGETPEKPEILRSALLRTTRAIFDGFVLIPATVWDGTSGLPKAAE